MTTIDLRTAMISPDARVWRLFPGENYKFLSVFEETNTAFLDMPGLELPAGSLADANRIDLSRRLRRTEILLEKIKQGGKGTTPTVTDAELQNFRVGKKRQRHLQAVVNFYGEAARGDLIIAPGRLSDGNVLIGQIRTHRIPDVMVPATYGDLPIPARTVRWVGRFPENKISTALSRSLRNEYPFSLIERSLFLEVFSLAFRSYVYGEHHSSTIFNTRDDYLDAEAALVGVVSNIAAVISEKVSAGNGGDLDLSDLIFGSASIEFRCAFACDIHSEGFARFTASRFTPLVIAAMIACLSLLSGCNSKAEMKTKLNQVKIENSSAPPDDACAASVSKTTLLALKSMGMDTVWRMCQNMKDAESRAGLKSSATVQK